MIYLNEINDILSTEVAEIIESKWSGKRLEVQNWLINVAKGKLE